MDFSQWRNHPKLLKAWGCGLKDIVHIDNYDRFRQMVMEAFPHLPQLEKSSIFKRRVVDRDEFYAKKYKVLFFTVEDSKEVEFVTQNIRNEGLLFLKRFPVMEEDDLQHAFLLITNSRRWMLVKASFKYCQPHDRHVISLLRCEDSLIYYYRRGAYKMDRLPKKKRRIMQMSPWATEHLYEDMKIDAADMSICSWSLTHKFDEEKIIESFIFTSSIRHRSSAAPEYVGRIVDYHVRRRLFEPQSPITEYTFRNLKDQKPALTDYKGSFLEQGFVTNKVEDTVTLVYGRQINEDDYQEEEDVVGGGG